MKSPLRRYIWCLTCFVPVVWLFVTILFLQYDIRTSNSIDEVATKETTTSVRLALIVRPSETVKIVKKIVDRRLHNDSAHVIRDNPEQVAAPIVDNRKLDLNAPGEMGKAMQIDKLKLLPGDLQKYEDGLEKNAFNAYASDLISIHRSLPDVRDEGCRKIEYKAPLVTASVVMCFHNEAWSVLLRSVHSIIDRSAPELLKEIILVDDFSDMEHLKQPLDDYMKLLGKVRIIRQKKREGLIRSRLAGAAAVNGEVIIFLDSHIEVTEGWLLPLLDPISQNRTSVITPVIDVIDDMTLKYTFGTVNTINVGGFDWNLLFNWHPLPDREKKKRRHQLEPVRSPTMAGGLFAISKQYFDDLGTYDAGMDIWGGENLEISFRIWMCGGTLLTAPCSHVGHIFRKRSPYKWSSGVSVVKKNTVRLAEVWLDEYKKFYYERINYDLGAYGDVTSRKLLREKLHCKSFKWYLTEIFPELFVPGNAVATGEIRSLSASFCVDGSTNTHNYHKPVIGFSCHNQGGNQYFMLSPIGEIRRDEGCLDYAGRKAGADQDDKVMVLACHGQQGNQRWIYAEKNQLYHPVSNLCMALSNDHNHIRMEKCNQTNRSHQWAWKRKPSNVTNKV